MKLDEFVATIENQIFNFKEYWEVNRKNDSEKFPNEMNYAEWFEQFVFHTEDFRDKVMEPEIGSKFFGFGKTFMTIFDPDGDCENCDLYNYECQSVICDGLKRTDGKHVKFVEI